MRPIEKKHPGDIVHYKDSHGNTIAHVIQANYQIYGDAKLPLTASIERCCSYCEGIREVDALEVEHVVARSQGGSKTEWNNLLLGCKLCNTVKSTKDIKDNIHWPHLNNTFLDFIYDEAGRVKVNPRLPELSKIRAQNLYDIVCLGRDNTDATPKDYRWLRRYEAWNKATDAKTKFEAGKWSEDDVIDLAKITGYWSVWFTVFAGIDAILSRLISDFAGTCPSCFDPNDHYKPIPRNPDNIEDPI